jgi:hypothetical protein
VKNNIFLGPGTTVSQGSAVVANNFTGNQMLVNRAGYDYHLLPGSPCIGAGVDPGLGGGLSLVPTAQYVHPANFEVRSAVGVIDIGAYEFGGQDGGTAGTGGAAGSTGAPGSGGATGGTTSTGGTGAGGATSTGGNSATGGNTSTSDGGNTPDSGASGSSSSGGASSGGASNGGVGNTSTGGGNAANGGTSGSTSTGGRSSGGRASGNGGSGISGAPLHASDAGVVAASSEDTVDKCSARAPIVALWSRTPGIGFAPPAL